MKRCLFIPLFLISQLTIEAADSPRPNILLILCDDLGYADVGFNGATDIQTPNLDALAKNGTIFTSAYVTHPFCGPSRMGLMTGRYPHSFGAPYNLPNSGLGIEEYNNKGIPQNETLISTVLQKANYFTGIVGKWHLGHSPDFHPNKRGFADFYGFLGGGHSYFPEKYHPIYDRQLKAGKKHFNEYTVPMEHNGKKVRETEYLTDGLSREAVRFISEAEKKEEPFFLYLAYNAPHQPLEAKKEDLKMYAGIKDKKRRIYAAMVHAVDRGIGKIATALQESDKLDNTLIVFLSDNGGKTSEGARNTPLNKGKGSVFEGGFRVPMFCHWPEKIPSGKRYDHPVSALDFYPTFAGLAGAAIPDGKKLDGKNIWADFVSGKSPHEGETIFAMRHRNGISDVGARRDQWKLVRYGGINSGWSLFDLDTDIGETKDLSSEHQEIVKEMTANVKKWTATHTEPQWFDSLKVRDGWREADMPNYEEMFRVKQ